MASTPLLVVFIHTTHHLNCTLSAIQCTSHHWRLTLGFHNNFHVFKVFLFIDEVGVLCRDSGEAMTPCARTCGMTCGTTMYDVCYAMWWISNGPEQETGNRWSASTSSPCGFTGRGIWRELMNASKTCLANSECKAVPVRSTLKDTKRTWCKGWR